jgi:cyclic pyranopterin phosphate synthase
MKKINTENAISFLEYRKKQEVEILSRQDLNSALSSILTVEVNITELCNRTCSFCPRVDPKVYPNKKVFISNEIVDLIIENLKSIDYKAKISFSGFGEPLLNKEFENIIKKFRGSLHPKTIIETNTNGDKFTPELINNLFKAGINTVYWNLYDGEHQIEEVFNIIKSSEISLENFKIRPHWEGFDTESAWGLILNNRSGAVKNEYIDATEFPLKRGCNYPFYKLFIDWNGDILCCSNDWLRKNIMGNITKNTLADIWLSKDFNFFRKNLLQKNRGQKPCNTCNVDGLLFGDGSRLILEKLIDQNLK